MLKDPMITLYANLPPASPFQLLDDFPDLERHTG
jgi:hypothetical protein